MTKFKINVKKTDDLTVQELLMIMAERIKVFVVEQECPYQEVDEKDKDATHVFFQQDNQLLAYTRIVPHDDGMSISFGRVLVVEEYRHEHLGQEIVQETIDIIKNNHPDTTIKIQAQAYLQQFYESFSFVKESDIYLEDGIPHMDMILAAEAG